MGRDALEFWVHDHVEAERAVHRVEVELEPCGVELSVVAGAEASPQLLAVLAGILEKPVIKEAADAVEDRVVHAVEERQVRLLLARLRRVVADTL